jgi:NadR type nicotinamide-nucleotide adenylyltransferase
VSPTTGLIIGRFCPPHLGHSHLIDAAAAEVDELTVVVFTKEHESVPGALRAGWLAELHPDVRVAHVPTSLVTDWNDPQVWEQWIALIRSVVPAGPDVVFSSERYGDEVARRLGARHLCVDPDRSTVPISATAIRADPLAHLEHLAPPVRAWYAAQAAGGGKGSSS